MEKEKLKGKTILIGKEQGQGRLCIAVDGKVAVIKQPGSVPGSVSRCKPQEGIAHAKIEIDSNGVMTITNMKSANVTYVDGIEIMSKLINDGCKITLGKDCYAIDVREVLLAAAKLMPEPEKIYNISHLARVWNDYHDGLRQLRERQRKINLVRTACGIFTLGAMPCMFFFGPIGYVLTGIGLIGNIYSFVGMKNDNTADEQERLTEKFQSHYVCPNNDCGKFLGNMSYKLMKKQYGMQCPYCKKKFVEQ